MDDYEKLMLLADIKQEALREAQLTRSGPTSRPGFNTHGLLLTLVVLLTGMAAWLAR